MPCSWRIWTTSRSSTKPWAPWRAITSLLETSRRLSAKVRQHDTNPCAATTAGVTEEAVLCRLGGDEFAILLDAISDPSDAMRVARNMLEAVAEPFSVEAREMRVSVSVGIALSAPTHARPEDMLKDAETAMRRAKSLGGSRCEVFDEAMHSQAVGRLRLETDLRTALTERQFRIHYQPVLHLKTRRIVSFEALLRWDHPTQGLISPERFIEAAEDTGILVSIGHWLILQACQQLRDWKANQVSDQSMNITVNVSARQFADARLVNDIQGRIAADWGFRVFWLQLEMTEPWQPPTRKLTVTVLAHLKHLGIGVIIDQLWDGGRHSRGLAAVSSGWTQNRSITGAEMQSDLASSDIVELITGLAQKMDMKVIGEGIENLRQMERLMELGCEYGQGYYLSQPMEAKAVPQFMREAVVPVRTKDCGRK